MRMKMLIFARPNFIIMKKWLITLAVFFLATGFLKAQLGTLLVKKSEKGLYVDHKVVAREGLYSIGRIYHVHPHHLAAFNNLDSEAGLNLGQTLRIPLTDTNFNQRSSDGLPIYYVVAAGDGLSAISRVHNRVPLERLRAWNDLRTDNINKGSKLIVGYLSMSSPAPSTAAVSTPAVKREIPAESETNNEDQTPAEKQEPVVTEEKQPEKPAATEVVKRETVSPPQNETRKELPQPTQSQPATSGNWTGIGFFKPYFEQQAGKSAPKVNETVTSGIFKTTSGWQDAKYYLLIDNVPTGSIVRLSNPANDKAVFAKVLGEMNGIRQNQGLNIRISNAAAAALGIGEEEKFVLQILY
jgi:LysM repeat protein